MKTHLATITEMMMLNGEACLRFDQSLFDVIRPGQFLQIFDPAAITLLPKLLYPCGSDASRPLFCGEVDHQWQPGTTLHIRGPRGNGFHLPPLARNVALAAFGINGANRLLPLARVALQVGAAVSMVTDREMVDLPAEIELLPLTELGNLKTWADYAAFILPPEQIEPTRQALQFTPGRSSVCEVEIQVDVPMICDEHSNCGVCGIQTTRGWRLACKDGPVFALETLAVGESAHG